MNVALYYATIHDVEGKSAKQLRLQKGEADAKELYEYEQQFDVESWYPVFAGETFESCFQPVLKDEARALLCAYGQSVLHGHVDSADAALLGELSDAEQRRQLGELGERIQRAIDQVNGGGGCFVRLSARSPKDSALGSAKMRALLRDELAQVVSDEDEDESDAWLQNQEFCAFFRAQIASLCVSSADEAMALLRGSERVYTDLKTAVRESSTAAGWRQRVGVRRWGGGDIAGEFRCFVFGRQLTAVSQYFHFVCFPSIARHAATIERAIRAFFDRRVAAKLPWDCCVLDVMVRFDRRLSARRGDTARLGVADVQIIEFNPFTRFTSAALFSWQDDAAVLRGEAPFEFRCLRAPLPFVGRPASQQLPCVASDVAAEYADVMALVRDYFVDDYARINAVLRYQFRREIFDQATARLPVRT